MITALAILKDEEEYDVTTVRATCGTCGDVETTIGTVRLVVCVSTTAADYAFQCPKCRLMVHRAANEGVVEALSNAGVQVVRWALPGELNEPKMGAPICHDDLLSFHLALERESWQDELAAMDHGW